MNENVHNHLTKLEYSVLEHLLHGDEPVLATLRAQLNVCRLQDRDFSGVGFFTTLKIPETTPRLDGRRNFAFGDIEAEIDGLVRGAGFVLFVEDGALCMLEGYTYGEVWPKHVSKFELSYWGGRRDLSALRKKWSR